jgi:hypothetical protein
MSMNLTQKLTWTPILKKRMPFMRTEFNEVLRRMSVSCLMCLYCIVLYFIHKSLQNDIGHIQRVVTVNSIRITVKANKHVNLI